MRFTGTTVLKVIDGKIAEEVGLDDGVTALTQLGLLKGRLIERGLWLPPRADQGPAPIGAPEFVAGLVVARLADGVIVAVEPVVARRRLHGVERIDAERGRMRACGLRGDGQGDRAGGFSALDPGDELRHELHGRRGIAVDGLSAGQW